MEDTQLNFFEDIEIEGRTGSGTPIFLEWSYSRRETLEQCARKYYYQYYGSSLKKSNNDPQKTKLHFLKTLQSRHLRLGRILHLVIKTYLKKLRQGQKWSLDSLMPWARKIYRTDLEYSRKYEHETPLLDERYPPVLLLEFYYDWPDARSLCTAAEERLVKALTNFVKSRNLYRFREAGIKPSALIEEFVYLKTAHFILRGAVDLVYWEGDRLVIVDWKIGSGGSSDDSLQMLAYALWAKQKFECSLDSIILHKAHLENSTVSTFYVNEKDISRVEARVLQDLERMLEANNFGKRGIVEAFTPCTQPKVCEMCQFQEVCPKE